jgi:hypothetical protein
LSKFKNTKATVNLSKTIGRENLFNEKPEPEYSPYYS